MKFWDVSEGEEMRNALLAMMAVLGAVSCEDKAKNCTPATQNATAQLSSFSASRSVAASNLPNDPFAHSKLQIADLAPFQAAALARSFNTDVQRPQVQLTAVVDQECVQNRRRAKNEKGEISSGIRLFHGLGPKSITVDIPTDVELDQLRSLANADQCLIGLGDAVVMHPFALPNDPQAGDQGHLTAIKFDQAYSKFFDPIKGIQRDVVIAIIDSGLDLSHEDIAANVWVNQDELPGNGVDDDRNGYVDDVNGYNFASNLPSPRPDGTWAGVEHGTHVAGLAAAVSGNRTGVSGVMGTRIKIMALNVFGKSWGAETSDIDNAIRYAANNGADVINLSLGGGGKTSSTESALLYSVRKGVVVVAAAGNDNRELTDSNFMTPVSYGAALNGMISVGSIDSDSLKRSSFSNYGTKYVEIGAPGAEESVRGRGVLSTVVNNGYRREEGTSMASPVVGGAAALAVGLIRSRGGQPTPAEVEAFLSAGDVISSLTQFFKGGNALDVAKLYEQIDKKYPASVKPTPSPTPLPSPTPGPTPTPIDSKPTPTPAPDQCT